MRSFKAYREGANGVAAIAEPGRNRGGANLPTGALIDLTLWNDIPPWTRAGAGASALKVNRTEAHETQTTLVRFFFTTIGVGFGHCAPAVTRPRQATR